MNRILKIILTGAAVGVVTGVVSVLVMKALGMDPNPGGVIGGVPAATIVVVRAGAKNKSEAN